MKRSCVMVALSIGLLAACSPMAQADTSVWSTVTDLQTSGSIVATNSVGCWMLGEATSTTGSDFQQLPYYTTSFGQETGGPAAWYGSVDYGAVTNYGQPSMYISSGHLNVHPGYPNATNPYHADLRWTAPSAGTYTVSATWTDLANGPTNGTATEGVEVYLAKSGVGMFEGFTSLEDSVLSASTTQQLTLAKGDTLDFIVDSRGSHWSDLTQLDATISAVPEPATSFVLTTGLVGLLAYAWRKRK